MLRALLAAPLLLASASPEPPEFEPLSERFADAEACSGHLARLVREARSGAFDAAEGPYRIGAGDVRAHTVRAAGSGHRIVEYRCAEAELASRSWTRSAGAAPQEDEEDFTVESVARRAPWLKH